MKKIATWILSVCTTMLVGFMLTACDGDEKHEHTYTEKTVVATCTEQGYTEYTCSCGESYRADEKEALGHDVEAHAGQAASCTQAGWGAYETCKREGCAYSTYAEIPTTGHSYGSWIEEVEADCATDTDGTKGHYHCLGCSKNFDADKVEIADLTIEATHAYGSWITQVEPDCDTDTDGVKGHYHCSGCDKDFDADKVEITDLTIEATHAYGSWIEEVEADCETDGVKGHYHCSKCDKNFDIDKSELTDITIPQTEHEYAKSATVVEPTCTERGYTIRTCVCGAEKQDTFVEATNHATPKLFTYDETYHYQTCACGERAFEETKTLHNYGTLSVCSCGAHSSIQNMKFVEKNGEYTVSAKSSNIGNEVLIPAYYKGKPVTRIKDFNGCRMTTVRFEENSQLRYIEESAFANCTSLQSIELPEGIIEIGASAFAWCDALTKITLPSTLQKIGEYALTYLPENVFKTYSDCYYVGSKDNPYLVLVKAKNTVVTDVTIHENTRFISNEAFRNCYAIYFITIPKNVEHIGANAFERCRELRTVTFANGSALKWIGDYAFSENANLSALVLPEGVEYVGGCVVKGSTALAYTVYENGQYIGTATNPHLVLCGTVSDAETLTIHANTKFISAYFSSCCPSLKTLEIPEGVISLGNGAFCWSAQIQSVKLPSTLKYIGDNAFKSSSISSIVIPKSVEYIGEWAFAEAQSLTEVSFEKGSALTALNSFVFQKCTRLQVLRLPESVKYIDNNCCSGSTGLQAVVLSAKCQVGGKAFEGCSSLLVVYFIGTPAEWEEMKTTYINYGNDYLWVQYVYYYSENEPIQPEAGVSYWYYDADGAIQFWS